MSHHRVDIRAQGCSRLIDTEFRCLSLWCVTSWLGFCRSMASLVRCSARKRVCCVFRRRLSVATSPSRTTTARRLRLLTSACTPSLSQHPAMRLKVQHYTTFSHCTWHCIFLVFWVRVFEIDMYCMFVRCLCRRRDGGSAGWDRLHVGRLRSVGGSARDRALHTGVHHGGLTQHRTGQAPHPELESAQWQRYLPVWCDVIWA